MKNPLVSAVITTYDRPARLRLAIESVVNQTYSPIELVVVDGGSPESQRAVVEDADTDGLHAVEFVRHETDSGPSAMRNAGIEHSSGEFVAFLDDDDRWKPAKIARQIDAFDTAPSGVGLVGTGIQSRDSNDDVIHRRRGTHDGTVTKRLLLGDLVPTSSILVRRDILDMTEGFDEAMWGYEDAEWLIRISEHCKFRSVEDPLVISRRSDGHENLSSNAERKADESHPQFMERCRPIAASFGPFFERKFVAYRRFEVGYGLLNHGHASRARPFLRGAVRAWPFAVSFLPFLVVSLFGDEWVRRARATKRRFA